MDTKRIECGRVWRESKAVTGGWESEDGYFRISPLPPSGFQLTSFLHEDADGNPRRWQFRTLHQAMEYAERM